MALVCLPRILSSSTIKTSCILSRAPKFVRIQVASIVSKENRDPNIKKPAPWPYKTKKYSYLWSYVDGTVKRFDENTKVIVVDGNIGAGKSSFAKKLAEDLDMEYFPEPTLEPYFVNPYGFDLRTIDELLPPSYKCCDISTFYKNPHHRNVPTMQFMMYMFRLEQYIDALAHLLQTGQGVILERCVYGDFVFTETMHKFGYLSDEAMRLYQDINKNTLEELLRPHLIIYLDISPETALERIKKRNDPVEVNSKVLTKEYLATLEHIYKTKYLKKMEEHAELLVYDWSKYGDVEVVVEDIEKIDFDRFTKYDKKMRDWARKDDYDWCYLRRWYTNYKGKIMDFGHIFRPSVTELTHPGDEAEIFIELMKKIPGEKYSPEFNPDAGDKVWFKLSPTSYWKSVISKIPF